MLYRLCSLALSNGSVTDASECGGRKACPISRHISEVPQGKHVFPERVTNKVEHMAPTMLVNFKECTQHISRVCNFHLHQERLWNIVVKAKQSIPRGRKSCQSWQSAKQCVADKWQRNSETSSLISQRALTRILKANTKASKWPNSSGLTP